MSTPGASLSRASVTPAGGATWRVKYRIESKEKSRAETAAGSDNTFKAVAEEWLAMKRKEWSAVHYSTSQRALERDIFPSLGNLPVDSITPAIIARAIADIHKRNVLKTATRILTISPPLIRLPW